MQPIIKVACSNYATYAIDKLGQPFSWGKGFLGHTGETRSECPTRIVQNTENRIFTDVYTNGDAALLFAPVRVYEIEPKCGPCKGGTQVKITGTGFADSDKLSVRFTFAEKTAEVPCYFDENDGSLVCTTPQFVQQGDELPLPCDCFLSVTLDGINYSECEESFKIYSNEIFLTSVFPKCGSVTGGSHVTLAIDIDQDTSSVLKDLKIGFQPKGKKHQVDASKAKQSLDKDGRTSSRLHEHQE